ncbi:MAG: hypothetical protein RL158_398 [Bacteroidota bacterium]
MLKPLLNTSIFIFCLFALMTSCVSKSSASGNKESSEFAAKLIDSSLTHNVIYVYDEVYSLETRYYDHQKQLIKTVKYDDIVRCVIYNVQSGEAMKLKSIELGHQ